MKYSALVNAICGTSWAIMPEKLQAIMSVIESRVMGVQIDATQIEAAKRATKFRRVQGSIGVIPIVGTIVQRAEGMDALSGLMSTQAISAALDEAMVSKDIGAVVFDVDSPGGSVFGVEELATKIYGMRGQKPMIAVVNSLMASAAYWLGTAADEVVVTPGGELGSIGVFGVHVDQSQAEEKLGFKTTLISAGKYKTEGNPHEPLSESGHAHIQERVDDYYRMFTKAVGRNRGVAPSSVRSGFGEGRVVGAIEAVAANMADRIATFEQVVADLLPKQVAGPSKSRRRAQLSILKTK